MTTAKGSNAQCTRLHFLHSTSPMNKYGVDFEQLQIAIAEAEDAGDRTRAAELRHLFWLDLHHNIATQPDPIIEELRERQIQARRRRKRGGRAA